MAPPVTLASNTSFARETSMKRIAIGVLALAVLSSASFAEVSSQAVRPAPSEQALAAAPLLQPTQLPWVEHPDARDYLAAYPSNALQRGINGAATLECLVQPDYRLACVVRSETPRHRGFAGAALQLSPRLKIAPTLD